MTNQSYDAIIEQLPCGFVNLKLQCDDQGQPTDFVYVQINRAFEEMSQLKRENLIGQSIRKTNIGKNFDKEDMIQRLTKLALQGGIDTMTIVIRKTGRTFKMNAVSPTHHEVVLFFTDISDSVKKISDFDVFFQISPDMLSISKLDGLYLKVNPAWKKILGYELDEVEGKYSWQFLHPDDQLNNRTISKQLENDHQVINFVNHYRHKDGTYRVIEWDAQLDGEKVYSIAKDITERIQKETQIEYLSFHDALTGLYNRRFLEEEAKRLDVPRNLPLTVIMGDVNRLKLVNDAFGHQKGDELIIQSAQAIKDSCRPEDLIARWGGDEFLVFLPKTTGEDAQKIIDRIHQNCATKTVNSIGVSIAFGSSTKGFLSENLNDVMRLAEDAMYKSKAKDGERSRRDIIDVIAATLYSKIPFEEQHAKRVSFLCQQMATSLGFEKEDIQKMALAGLLHDIGKVAISTDILTKTTPLTLDEWQQLKTHTEIGAKVVGNGDSMSDIGQAILHHHERFDGSGYPKGIAWDNIPIAARIITIADSYDTMISQHDYKAAKSRQEAIEELQKNSGTQFDPKLAYLFIETILGEQKNHH